jgi:hypothetical protein
VKFDTISGDDVGKGRMKLRLIANLGVQQHQSCMKMLKSENYGVKFFYVYCHEDCRGN